MRLALVLFILKLKLTRAAVKDLALSKKISQRDYTIVIRTQDRKHGRYFIFTNGTIVSANGLHPQPDIEMVWKDVGTAFKSMAFGGKADILQAMGRSELIIEGNLDHYFWFGDMLDLMMES